MLPRWCVTGLLGQCPLQGVPCNPILAVGVLQGMNLQWGQFACPRSEPAVKPALWLFLCITLSLCPCPCVPACITSPHVRVSQCVLSLVSCCSRTHPCGVTAPDAKPWLWQRGFSPTEIQLLFPSVWMMPSHPSAVGNLG